MNIFKEALLQHIGSTICYRKVKASKHPDDARNLACAEALEDSADVVKALPDDHPLFAKLEKVNEPECDCWNERENQFISRWGFFNAASPADSGFRFVAMLAESADEYLTQHKLEKVGEKLYEKFVDYFNEDFIGEVHGALCGFFEGKLTDDFMVELAEQYRDESAMMFVGGLRYEISSGKFETESYMDKAVSEHMEQHADKILGEWADEFISQIGDKVMDCARDD
ncbi:MAG TPA: hypothetical protein DD418_20945 [Pseudomonas sp.]|nr:hypothetical protein [Pseudomonas sp.]